jgi:hypothetical protein
MKIDRGRLRSLKTIILIKKCLRYYLLIISSWCLRGCICIGIRIGIFIFIGDFRMFFF